MKYLSRKAADRLALDTSLRRLGIVELEQRLEFSPLLTERVLPEATAGGPAACCVCKIPEDDLGFPDIHVRDPFDSTGPTDGGLTR